MGLLAFSSHQGGKVHYALIVPQILSSPSQEPPNPSGTQAVTLQLWHGDIHPSPCGSPNLRSVVLILPNLGTTWPNPQGDLLCLND